MKLLRIEGTKRVRLLPWHYEEFALEVSMYGLTGTPDGCRQTGGKMVTGTSPRTFGAPDPLWDLRHGAGLIGGLISWQFYIAPCIEPPDPQIKMLRLMLPAYKRILERMLGTPAMGRSDKEIMDALCDLPGDLTLAEALAAANPPMENGWIEEPLDVTSIEEGCDIILRKQGMGMRTAFETTFEDSAPVVTEAFREELERLQESRFDPYKETEMIPRFDLERYLAACKFGSVIVTNAVQEQLAALPS